MQTIKPHRLLPGDTIAVVSPSWGGAGLFPHRVELAQKQLARMGFSLKVAPHALETGSWTSASPEQRAADIHTAFRDPEVRAVIAAIGGDHSNQLLPLLDFDLLRAHPKIFIGYSDITVLNLAIWKLARLVTFNGPALLTDFAEYPQMFSHTRAYFEKAVCSGQPVGEVSPSAQWTEEFLDWSQKLDLSRPRRMQPADGWAWLKPGKAEGILLGGCLESLDHLRGTPCWPEEQDWQGALLFIETSEEAPPPERVDSMLMDYENMGVFDLIGGLLVGRPMRYSPEQKALLREVLLARTAKYRFPLVAEMDFGHTAPQITLPLGCRARLDSAAQTFSILEAAVE